MQKNVISNIKCYNEPQDYTGGTEYVSCFYSDLFSYLVSNNKSVIPFIANNVFYYGYTPEETDLRKRYGIVAKSIVNTNKLALSQGIKVTNENIEVSEIFNFIKKHIDLQEPVSVAVDMFELSYRPDRYKKVHTIHYFMIYGYDDNIKIFNIIDNPKNTYYKKVTCSYEDFKRGYESGKEFFEGMETVCFGTINNTICNIYRDYKDIFIQNYLSSEECIIDNLKALPELKKDFENISKLYLHTDRGMNLFYLIHYQLMNIKRAELFAYYKILNMNKILEPFGEIVKGWEKVRNILNYCIQKERIDFDKLNNAVGIIGHLCDEELAFYENLFVLLKSI